MATPSPENLTHLLAGIGRGDRLAADRLFPLVYDELRSLAGRYLRRERPDHTLQATALVHEAYLKLMGGQILEMTDRAQFLALAATAMRRILVNHARSRGRLKRGGGRSRLVLDEAVAVFQDRAFDLLALDEAMTRLAAIDPPLARVVELRFFGGLSVEETAALLDVSVRTVQYDWAMARAWLRGELAEEAGHDG